MEMLMAVLSVLTCLAWSYFGIKIVHKFVLIAHDVAEAFPGPEADALVRRVNLTYRLAIISLIGVSFTPLLSLRGN